MAHMQQQILDAIQARLIAGDTSAGEDVYLDRLDPLPKGSRYAVFIREGDNGEDIQPGSIRDVQQRTLAVEIACALRASEDAAVKARAFGLAVEKLLSPKAPNTSLMALCTDWRITNSRLVQSGAGEEAIAARAQSWQFTYFTRKATPDAAA